MSKPVSALNGASYSGLVQITEIGPLGMITLRAKPDCPGLDAAIKAATGCARPAQRQIETKGGKSAGWMSPDEYLLIVPYQDAGKTIAAIAQALAGQHFLAADVSDARAVFDISGDGVLEKLTPTNFDALGPKELRRTRAAQVAAAFWREGGGYRLVCFRSVAAYMMGLLTHSALPGSALE